MILHENACVLREVRSESMCIGAAISTTNQRFINLCNKYGVDSELYLFCG